MKIIYSLLLCAFANVAIACSCGEYLIDLPLKEMGWTQTESEGLESISDLVFSGVLLDMREVDKIGPNCQNKEKEFELVFKLIKSYKGAKNDTLKIRTNTSSDACGFYAPKNTECLIFAAKGNFDTYYTYRSHCCKSISKHIDEKRYNKYIKFLESLTNMTDGEYVFHQLKSYWAHPYKDSLEAIRYNIKNGKLDGFWQVTDRRGRVLEKGNYKNGQKVGTWEITSYISKDIIEADIQVKIEKIYFKNGRPHHSLTIIEDILYIWEPIFKTQVIRRQKIRKKYKYFKP